MVDVTTVPEVVADLTFAPVRGGRTTVPPGCWEEDRPPLIGESVAVKDGGAGPYTATITEIEADGTLVLAVHAFVPAHTQARQLRVEPTEDAKAAMYSMSGYEEPEYANFGSGSGDAVRLEDYDFGGYRG